MKCSSLIVLLVIAGASVRADTDGSKEETNRRIKLTRSSVFILYSVKQADGKVLKITGSGVLVSKLHNLVLTNAHVAIANNPLILFPKISPPGDEVLTNPNVYGKSDQILKSHVRTGTVVARDNTRDLALLRLNAPAPDDAREIHLGWRVPQVPALVYSVGNSRYGEGHLFNYSEGKVDSLGRTRAKAGERDFAMISASSQITFGDSGGLLADEHGRLVGLTQGGSSEHRRSYFIELREILGFFIINRSKYEKDGWSLFQEDVPENELKEFEKAMNPRLNSRELFKELERVAQRTRAPGIVLAAAAHERIGDQRIKSELVRIIKASLKEKEVELPEIEGYCFFPYPALSASAVEVIMEKVKAGQLFDKTNVVFTLIQLLGYHGDPKMGRTAELARETIKLITGQEVEYDVDKAAVRFMKNELIAK